MNNSLKDKFLYYCAPESNDDYFNNSLIYLCANDNKGSYGLIINRTVEIKLTDFFFFNKLEIGSQTQLWKNRSWGACPTYVSLCPLF